MGRWLSLGMLLAIIAVVAFVFFWVMSGFVLPLFLAAILVILFRPFHERCLKRWPERERLAAVLTTAAVILLVILPTTLVMTLAAIEASTLASNLSDRKLKKKIDDLRLKFNLDYEYAHEIRYLESSFESLEADAANGAAAHGELGAYKRLVDAATQLESRLSPKQRQLKSWTKVRQQFEALETLSQKPESLGTLRYQALLRTSSQALRSFKVELMGDQFRAWLKEIANPSSDEIARLTGHFFAGAPGFLRDIGGATSSFLASLAMQSAIMVLSMYFFLIDGPHMIATIMRLSPLEDAYERELIDEFDRISRAVVMATLLSAVAQGILAGFGLWLSGIQSVFLLSMITIIFGLVPFVGSAAVIVPACLWLYFSEGRPWAALMLGAYGLLVVGTADNFIKPMVLHGQSHLHPLLALLSVLGGVQVLGAMGILVGPMVVVFLQTLLNILQQEVMSLDKKSPPRRTGKALPTAM